MTTLEDVQVTQATMKLEFDRVGEADRFTVTRVNGDCEKEIGVIRRADNDLDYVYTGYEAHPNQTILLTHQSIASEATAVVERVFRQWEEE